MRLMRQVTTATPAARRRAFRDGMQRSRSKCCRRTKGVQAGPARRHRKSLRGKGVGGWHSRGTHGAASVWVLTRADTAPLDSVADAAQCDCNDSEITLEKSLLEVLPIGRQDLEAPPRWCANRSLRHHHDPLRSPDSTHPPGGRTLHQDHGHRAGGHPQTRRPGRLHCAMQGLLLGIVARYSIPSLADRPRIRSLPRGGIARRRRARLATEVDAPVFKGVDLMGAPVLFLFAKRKRARPRLRIPMNSATDSSSKAPVFPIQSRHLSDPLPPPIFHALVRPPPAQS